MTRILTDASNVSKTRHFINPTRNEVPCGDANENAICVLEARYIHSYRCSVSSTRIQRSSIPIPPQASV